MKKSLLIAPALGVLVLAAAGSVGGTVAWFSANNTWDMSTSEFAITKLDGNIKATITKGHGTAIDGENPKKVVLDEAKHVKLTHASFDHNTGVHKIFSGTHGETVYTQRVNGLNYTEASASTDDAKTAYDNSWIAGHYKTSTDNDSDIYWAASWDVTFTYSFPENNAAAGLYFDLREGDEGSKATFTKGTGEQTENTYKGFRLAIVGISSSVNTSVYNTRVWAPFVTTSKYVKNGSPAASTDYAIGTFIGSDAKSNSNYIAESNPGKADASELFCLGQFNGNSNSDSSLTFTFVAWYEGTDETNVVDEATLDRVATSLKFYTRQATAA
jgi:hypothetical protein